jgi:hypothetical protein
MPRAGAHEISSSRGALDAAGAASVCRVLKPVRPFAAELSSRARLCCIFDAGFRRRATIVPYRTFSRGGGFRWRRTKATVRASVTAIDAIERARRQWGTTAGILNGDDPGARCIVGVLILGRFTLLGKGETWEDAFSSADRSTRLRPGERAARR